MRWKNQWLWIETKTAVEFTLTLLAKNKSPLDGFIQ